MSGETPPTTASSSAEKSPSSADFKFIDEIGHGAFSTVYRALEISSKKVFAIKVVEKAHAVKNRSVDTVMIEKEVLSRTSHPLIVRLYSAFQDSRTLYFVLDNCELGDLQKYLNRLTSLDLLCTRFYTAEILLAVEYLHSQSIVHRDVKPENVLLCASRHIKLADFGSSTILKDCKIKAPSFTGSPQFVSPEMIAFMSSSFKVSLAYNELDKSVKDSLTYLMDYWSLGCVIYQLLSGQLPFGFDPNSTSDPIFDRILNLRYQIPDGFDQDAVDLVKRLFVLDPRERLGSDQTGGIQALKEHPFFADIDWKHLLKLEPPNLKTNVAPLLDEKQLDKIPAGYEPGQLYMYAMEIGLASQLESLSTDDKYKLKQGQFKNNIYYRFVNGRIIIKQGILYKRRGLFAKKRMFILTDGPRLFYVDPEKMELEGEIPFSETMKIIQESSPSIFSIHTPNKIYYLEDPKKTSPEWIQYISDVYMKYYKKPICVI